MTFNLSSLLKAFSLALALVSVTALAGCSTSNRAEQKSNLTAGTVKKRVVKGKTSQAEIVQVLGSPNIVTRNGEGDEIWTYSRQSYDSESGGFGGGLLIFGGNRAFSSGSSNSFDLILTFDKSDVVKDYSMVSSQF